MQVAILVRVSFYHGLAVRLEFHFFAAYLLVSIIYCYKSWHCIFEVSGKYITISVHQYVQGPSEIFQNFHKSYKP